MFRANDVSSGDDHCVLQAVFQLANVPGPVMPREERDTLVGHQGCPTSQCPALTLDQVLDQEGNVLPPLTKRWEENLDDAQAVVEIPAKLAPFHYSGVVQLQS